MSATKPGALATTTTTLSTFAKSVHDAISSGLLKKSLDSVLFVTGNESADLDSCASSIMNAYLYTIALEQGSAPKLASTVFPSFSPSLVIPFINIPREDLNLRPDVKYLLQISGYNSQSVAFLDDFEPINHTTPNQPFYNPTDAYSFVVDHNKLNGPVKQLFTADRVVGILDHHDDENSYQHANPRIIKKTGSCMSIIVNYWRNQLKECDSIFKNEANLSVLGLGPILSDTNCLRSKVEPEDVDASTFLIEAIKSNKNALFTNYTQLSDQIDKKKKDVSSMTGYELLRKDYKEWTKDDNDPNQKDIKIGISSIPKSLSFIYSKYGEEQFQNDLKKWALKRHLDLTVVMTTYTDESGTFSRDLLIFSTSDKISTSELKKVIENISETLNLKETTPKILSETKGFFQFLQGDIKSSRKQVAPLLRHYIQGAPLNKL